MKKLITIFIVLIPLICASRVLAAPYSWPSDGYVYYRFGDTTSYTSNHTNSDGTVNHHFHTGIDIWSNSDGLWNGHVEGASNPIYAVTTGYVLWIGGSGLIVANSDGKFSDYWHVKNLAVSTNTNVTTDTLLGYQNLEEAVHVHITISTISGDDGHIDPSPYFETYGYQLDVSKANAMPGGTYVTRSSSCSGATHILINKNVSSGSNYTCSASQSIKVLPNSTFSLGSNVRLFVN